MVCWYVSLFFVFPRVYVCVHVVFGLLCDGVWCVLLRFCCGLLFFCLCVLVCDMMCVWCVCDLLCGIVCGGCAVPFVLV